MIMKPKAIIFDWDGTLADTRGAVVNSMNYVLNKYNLEDWDTVKTKYRDTSKSLKENFFNFFKENSKQAYEEYLSFYKEKAFSSVKSIPYAKELLEFLQSQKIKTYIISNKEKSLLLNEVNKCFPSTQFECIFANGDTLHNKPNPEPVLKILKNRDYEITPQTVWFIGDTKQDIDCAIASNCKAILIGFCNLITLDYI